MITFWGKVQKGHSRGKDLGFPSINVNLKKNIEQGIYISQIQVDGKIYNSLTFIGAAITFGDKKFHSETYLLDFSGNLYNKWISIRLMEKIRGNKKFDKVEDLIKEMKNDEKIARAYFMKH